MRGWVRMCGPGKGTAIGKAGLEAEMGAAFLKEPSGSYVACEKPMPKVTCCMIQLRQHP